MRGKFFARSLNARSYRLLLVAAAATLLASCEFGLQSRIPGLQTGDTVSAQLRRLESEAQSGGRYYIDLSADETFDPWILRFPGRSDVTVTLRGGETRRTLSLAANGSIFDVAYGVTLVLGNNVTLRGLNENSVALVRVSGRLLMEEGSAITGNTGADAWGAGVQVYHGGRFYMRGGEIRGNSTANSGGGVLVDGIFNMSGGVISDNTGRGSGGGVFVSAGGEFTLENGTISGNTAASGHGGGVFLYGGDFTMRDGVISGNTAYSPTSWVGGGGVFVGSGLTFVMYGGEISGNTAAGHIRTLGGGVYVSGTFVMHDGRISGNTAVSATTWAQSGGVNVDGGTFVMHGGEISGNVANGNTWAQGGGVSVQSYHGALFAMHGGRISGNETISNLSPWGNGGGVHVCSYNAAGGTFQMSGGVILANNIMRHAANMAGSSSALTVGYYRGSAIAQYGTFSNGIFHRSGDLPPVGHIGHTIGDTIGVVNGVLHIGEISIPGNTLAAQLAWLRDYAASYMQYVVEISGDHSLTPAQAVLPFGLNDVAVTLRGGTTRSIVSLSGHGSLFTVRSGVTLRLGDNITLRGTTANTASLVSVAEGGSLRMLEGSVITGNTNTSWSGGGGVRVLSGGAFVMYDGEIYGNFAEGHNWSSGGGVRLDSDGTFVMHYGRIRDNTSSRRGGGVTAQGAFTMHGGEISNNTVSSTAFWVQGGGVHVYIDTGIFDMRGGRIFGNNAFSSADWSVGGGVFVQGTFNMHDGEISGNTVSSTAAWSSGGGVFVDSYRDGGTFLITGGIIHGSNAEGGLGNVAAGYDALWVGGLAQYGLLGAGGGLGNLPSSNNTVEVRNGVLQGVTTVTITGIPSAYVGLLGFLFLICPSDWDDFSRSTATITGSSASFVFLGVAPGSYDIHFVLRQPGGSYDLVRSDTIFSGFVTAGNNTIPFSTFHDGDGHIPAQWQGTFGEPPHGLTLYADGVITWSGWTWSSAPSGTRTGVTIEPGGTGGVAAMGITAQWVYVAIGGVRQGIIMSFTPAVEGAYQVIGMGYWGAYEVLQLVGDFGGVLSPWPNTWGFPGFPVLGDGMWAAR